MTSAVKSFLVLLIILPLVIYIGAELGSDDYVLPFVIAGLVVTALIVTTFFRGQRLECLILAFLLSGYIIGNRGFAQLSVVPPLFVGEVGLAAIMFLMVIRYIFERERVLPKDALAKAIFVYLGVAFARFIFDYRLYHLDAARDAAIIYYALFFFAAYALGKREASKLMLERVLIWAFSLQAIVAAVSVWQPDWLDLIEVRGTPLFAQKGDLTPTFSSAGVFFLALRSDLFRPAWLRQLVILTLLTCVAMIGSRAGYVALMAAWCLPWIAMRGRFSLYPALFAALVAVAVLFASIVTDEGPVSEAKERVISMFDVTGGFQYETELGDMKAATNDFRRELWRSFYDQTVEDNNWELGRGFGYDFLPRFEETFLSGTWEGLRSAHNYFMTVFGRLGVLGAGILLAITFFVIRDGVRSAMMLRRGEVHDATALAYWSGAWAILASGTFGVVMEGPMGAIPFWTFLGMALSQDEKHRVPADVTKVLNPAFVSEEAWQQPHLV